MSIEYVQQTNKRARCQLQLAFFRLAMRQIYRHFRALNSGLPAIVVIAYNYDFAILYCHLISAIN